VSNLVSDIYGGTETEVFENRVLWRISGSKRDEVIGGWGKLNKEEIHILNYSPILITRRMRWPGM
jgi:hypothetical protein